MKDQSLKMAGSAFVWRALQLVGVKLIFFIRLLVLARLLLPEDFGLLAIAVSTIGIFLSLTDVGMIPALVQGQQVADKDYDTAWTVGLTRALVISLILIIAAPLIANIYAEPRATPIIQVLALRPLLEAMLSIRIADLTRRLQFRPLAILYVAEALTNTIVSIAFAKLLGVWTLVAGVLAGSIVNLILSYILAPYLPRISFDRSSIQSLIRFGRWIFINSLIAMVGTNIMRIIISRQLGATGLGLFFLATQLAFLPSDIANEVVGSVTFPLFSRLQSNVQQLTRAFKTTLVGMAALLFPVSALLIALAPTFIQEILGPKWEGTEPVIRILSLATIVGLFGDAVLPMLKGIGQPYRVTIIILGQYFMLVLIVWPLTGRFGITGAALAWLPGTILSQILCVIYVHKVLYKPYKPIIRPLSAVVLATTIGAVFAYLINEWLAGLYGLGVAILVSIILIAAILWYFERRLSLGFAEDLGLVYPKIASWLGFRLTSVKN